jgi:diguanylate cyclase (GGDEF)-like protein
MSDTGPTGTDDLSPYDAESVVVRLLDRLRRRTAASRVAVWVHEDTTRMVVPYRQSVSPEAFPASGPPPVLDHAVPLDRAPLMAAVVRDRRPVRVEGDPDAVAPGIAAQLGVDSVHAAPLLVGDRVVAVLTVEPATASGDAALQVTSDLARAVSAAWSRRSELRRLAQAEVLLGLIEAAAQARSVEHLLAVACEQLAELGGVERACVFLVDEDGRLVPRMAGYADGRRDVSTWRRFRTAPVPLRLAETVLRTGEPQVADGDSDQLAGWWVDTFSIASALAVPLGRYPDVSGVLTLDGTRLRTFTEDVRRLAAAAGTHLGSVIEQAGTSEARAASLRTARAVRQMLVDGAGAIGVDEAAEVLARAVQDLTGTERSAAYLVGEDGTVESVLHMEWPPEHRQVVADQVVGVRADDVPLWRATVRDCRPVFVEDAGASDLLDPRLVAALQLRSYVSVPLLSGDRLLGLVVTGSVSSSVQWSPAVHEAVRQVALEGALVIENAKLRAAEQQRLQQLAREAHQDPLTGLANRRRFTEELERAVHRPDGRPCAVVMIDLDRFKEVNDSFGHNVGDDLLCLVGPRLERALRPGDLLARMGGDEFAVLLPGAGEDGARAVAARLGDVLHDAFALDGMSLTVDASIGVSLYPDHGRDRSLLMARADTAMYAAKRGRQGHEVWGPDVDTDSRSRLETLEQLRVALDGDQLTNHYQPKLDLHTGRVTGVEALVRWQHPERGLLAPGAFLPLAEQAGLMRRLALLVLERAVRDLRAWRAGRHELSMAVNLSVSNLQDVALPEQVGLLLATYGVPADALVLEITEDVLMADAARTQQVMAELRRLGVRLSIDDYGTGYSSLAYLRALPVDELKLDRSFVSSLTTDAKAAAIVRSTLQLSRDLGITMVVEGVEDAAALDALSAWNCDLAQGYHIARPMPAEQLLSWLRARPVAAAVS